MGLAWTATCDCRESTTDRLQQQQQLQHHQKKIRAWQVSVQLWGLLVRGWVQRGADGITMSTIISMRVHPPPHLLLLLLLRRRRQQA